MTIIARRLNERGIKSPEFYMRRRIADWKPKLSKRYLWVASAIKRILNNELYIGTMVNHKTASNKIRKTKTFIPPEQQFRHPNFCQPIIEQGIWDQVQFLSAQRAATRPRASGGRNIHRYTGIIKCAECGASLIARTRHWRGTEYVEYVCNSNHRYGKSYCTPHVVRESKLDEMVVSHIRSLQDRILAEAEKYDGIVKEWGRKKPQYDKKIEDYESKLEKLNREIENLIIDRINDRPHAELYTKMIEDREKQIENINRQIADCKEYDCVSRQKHKNLCETSKVIEEILKNGHISDAHIRMLIKQVNVHQNEDKSIDISFEINGDWEGSKAIYVDPRA